MPSSRSDCIRRYTAQRGGVRVLPARAVRARAHLGGRDPRRHRGVRSRAGAGSHLRAGSCGPRDGQRRHAPPVRERSGGQGAGATRAEREAARALELDPELAEAHLARAAVARKADFDWGLTLEESARALELNPTSTSRGISVRRRSITWGCSTARRTSSARRNASTRRTAPSSSEPRGVVAFLHGRNDEAVRKLEETRHTQQPGLRRLLSQPGLLLRGRHAPGASDAGLPAALRRRARPRPGHAHRRRASPPCAGTGLAPSA